MKKILLILALLYSINFNSVAQPGVGGDPDNPPTEEPPGGDYAAIPVDGGITAFVLSAALIGTGVILRRKRKLRSEQVSSS